MKIKFSKKEIITIVASIIASPALAVIISHYLPNDCSSNNLPNVIEVVVENPTSSPLPVPPISIPFPEQPTEQPTSTPTPEPPAEQPTSIPPTVISLLDLPTFTQSRDLRHIKTNDRFRDNLYNADFERGFTFRASGVHIWRTEFTYLLNEEFITFNGTLAVEFSSRNLTGDRTFMTFSVYGNERRLYHSQEMRGGVIPSYFEIDIQEVHELRILVEMSAGVTMGQLNVLLLDPQLTRIF